MLKKLALAGVLAVSMVLSGCTTIGPVLTGQVANPITPRVAAELTAAVDEVTIAAGVYASLPRCSHNPQPCSSQAVVNQLRIYVHTAKAATARVVDFAFGNTSLNAVAIYRAAIDAISIARGYGTSHGVTL